MKKVLPDEHFREQCTQLSARPTELIEFLLDTARPISSYLEQKEKPKRMKRLVGGRLNLQVEDTEELDQLSNDYFFHAGMCDSERKQATYNEAAGNATFSCDTISAKCCSEPDILILNEAAVCGSCGSLVKDSVQLVANYTEARDSPNKSINFDGNEIDKTKSFLDSMLYLQGMRCSSFSKREWARIYHAVVNGFPSHEIPRISCEHVSRVLHTLGMNQFYKDQYIIWEKITGNKLRVIPDGALWAIRHIIIPKLNDICQVEKDAQRIAAGSLLYKALQLCGETELGNFMVKVSGEGHQQKLNTFWKRVCEEARWKYYKG